MIRLLLTLVLCAASSLVFADAPTVKPADGLWRTYDRKGNLDREENYRNRLLYGDIKSFYPSGALRAVTQYVDDKRQGLEKTYYENGGLASESGYVDNDLEGLSHHYYDTGELEREAYYKKGSFNGETKVYYKSGAIKQQLQYKEGVLDGTSLTFNENGQVVVEETYRKGTLSERKDYSKDSSRGALLGSPIEKTATPQLETKAAISDKPIQPPK